MKSLLSLGSTLVLTTALLAAPHGHGGHGHSGSGKGGHGSSHGAYAGKGQHVQHGHRSFNRNWHGWTRRVYSVSWGTDLYWSPDENCWYYYDDNNQTYVPCE